LHAQRQNGFDKISISDSIAQNTLFFHENHIRNPIAMKETSRRRRITVTSSLNEITPDKDKLGNRVVGGGGVASLAPTPFHSRLLYRYLKTT
jgi:hypothetical protein